jgi:hypothetical protein
VPACGVHIRYPYGDDAADESWLEEEAERHGGRLSEQVFLSDPLQRLATFPDRQSAHAFTGSLNQTQRWHACIRGQGCLGW